MATIIRMPGVLAGSQEAVLAGWLVAVGDTIAVGDPIAEIETEKATVEYAAETAGVLGRTLVGPGDSTEVGDPIAVLRADGEGDAEIDAVLAGAPGPDSGVGPDPEPGPGAGIDSDASPAPTTTSSNTAVVARDPESATPVVEASSVAGAAEAAAGAVTAASPGRSGSRPPSSGGRLFASPIARRIARDRNIDIAAVIGTGPGGRISRRDVELVASRPAEPAPRPAAEAAPPAASPSAAPRATGPSVGADDWDEIPHTGMRKAIARRLTESKSTVPHFYLTTECVVDELLALRARINETSPVRVSVNDLVVKAVAAAFADVPEANVTWTDTAMRRHRRVDIAIAVATDGGLLTPVLRDAGSKSLTAVSTGIAELVAKARDRKLRQDELEGGSFSVTNLGMYGTLEFSAILNPPQSGILAVGAATKRAVVDEDGELAVATVVRCTLSVDHRAVDGALAAQWLAAFTTRIENPLSVLI
ncbi:dihydrolipoamide acetyltransferase family protein [Herbiconiux sp. 11R-BC]|uniref:dihydrolipoamide acetyltransferase family protein n=1 Tax=Herbiconiux sp. 11R-BC TaxID=3111637 RepID=UPI003BFC76B7